MALEKLPHGVVGRDGVVDVLHGELGGVDGQYEWLRVTEAGGTISRDPGVGVFLTIFNNI